MEKLLQAILMAVRKDQLAVSAYEDLYHICREALKSDKALAIGYLRRLSALCEGAIRNPALPDGKVSDLFALHKRVCLAAARDDFESYLLYVEWNRAPEEKFYAPRRGIMSRVVNALQRLTDDELDELFLSMPPRVGKTTVLMFFATWLVGRDSEKSNLYSAYSDVITSAFYSGALEIIQDPVTYLWHDVFPEAKIAGTNAQAETLNIGRGKRYPSLTCRSLYGTLNGACDCNGFLISDDLIGGIEEALNKDRLLSAWSKVDNNLIPRAKEHAKVLWCGTRWSMVDPAGLRMDLLLNDEEYKDRRVEIINLPALDENEHSNFNYQYGVGFSEKYFKQRRASFERNNDMASWAAQYMQDPIERSGALFEPQDMRFYNGVLPDKEPVRIFMAVDPAFGGGDFVSAPICYQFDDGSVYVHDVVYNDGDKKITQPAIIRKILEHHVQAAQFEANKSTASYKEDIEKALKDMGYRLNITTKAAPSDKAKETRIWDKAPEIREFYFREDGKRHKEYSQFMQNVFSFKLVGRNKHDDSVDSLAQACNMLRGGGNKVEIFQRPW